MCSGFVVEQCAHKVRQCVVNCLIEDCEGTANNRWVEIEEVDVVDSIATPNPDTDPPTPLEQ